MENEKKIDLAFHERVGTEFSATRWLARWFFQHRAFYNNEKLPKSIKIAKYFFIFCLSSEILFKSGHTGSHQP